jgi:Galactose oxidase, central domain
MISRGQRLQVCVLSVALMGLVGIAFAQNDNGLHFRRHKHRSSVVLLAGGIDNITVDGSHIELTTAELYHQRFGQFTATGSMNFPQLGQAATRLRDGKVLIGEELYDPRSGTFSVTDPMTVGRVGNTATLLRDGRVLVAGGETATAELYDPVSASFTLTGSMTVERTDHSATLLRDGTVLIAGGQTETGILASAETYDPATGQFSATGSMTIPREFQTATLLQNERVLIAAGGTGVGGCINCSTASAELYDPVTREFSSTGSLTTPRRGQSATLLSNGEVLMTGGIDDESQCGAPEACILKTAELYDPTTGSFRSTGDMSDFRFDHTANLLDNGKVLVAGGFDTGLHITDTAELYTPSSGTFAQTGNMTDARAEHTATELR